MVINTFKHLSLVVFVILMSAGASGASNYPASFRAGKMEIPTLKEYLNQLKLEYAKTNTVATPLTNVEYKGKIFSGFNIETRGLIGGYKTTQFLTYIKFHKGLWKLVFINGETCSKGTVSREGKLVEIWICEDVVYPVTSPALFIMADKAVNLEELSRVWGRKVVLNEKGFVEEEKKKKEISLGDMKQIMVSKGAVWETNKLIWVNEQPALLIKVSGIYAKKPIVKYWHTFLYVIDGDRLRLREIEGRYCHYESLIKKDLCEDIYTPTIQAPFELVLINSDEKTIGSSSGGDATEDQEDKDTSDDDVTLYCGNIGTNYDQALMFHFTHSRMFSHDISGYRKAIARLPYVVDPKGLFLDRDEKLPYQQPNDETLKELVAAVNKGVKGDCSEWVPFIDPLKERVLARKSDVYGLIDFLKVRNYQQEKIKSDVSELNQRQRVLLDFMFKNLDSSLQALPAVAVDMAAGQFLEYYKKTLKKVSSYEEIITTSMVSLDKFSRILEPSPKVSSSLHNENKYFGVSILKGVSDHYIYTVVDETFKTTGLRLGDLIKKINGETASTMSAREIDKILLDTKNSISLQINRQGQSLSILLEAQPLDLLKPYYSTELIQGEDQRLYLKIKVDLFVEGVTNSIFKAVQAIVQENPPFDGFILDLQSNPGGRFSEAVKLISLFVKDKTILFKRIGARNSAAVKAFSADGAVFISESIPLVVEVDSSSRSSSELVASSLKSLNRSITIGAKTYGKYIAQSYFAAALSNGENFVMAITSTEFYDVQGKTYHGIGVQPDIKVFSLEGGVFRDGNGPGNNYEVPEGAQAKAYPSFITAESLLKIQNSVVVDETTIDAVAVEVLNQAL